MRGPELDRMRDRDDFDPAVEGARYRLSRELSLVVWERACADASDDRGRLDAEQAQQRFHEFAARIAACGGRLRPDVGRLTRVGVELDGELPGIAAQLALRTAGRETLVASEARRWRPAIEGQAATADSAVAAAVDHDVAPHTDELRPAEVLDRRRRPHGPWFDDVELHAGSAERPTGQPTALPGFAGAAELRAQLLAAATRGRGASEALAAADPATAALALRELRAAYVPGQTAPALQLVARASDGEAARILGRGSAGAALPGDLAARLGPHVGDRAAGTARLHTDDTADLVAAAHHARAVTLGDRIYFARGEYAPGTERGDELLAHELTHVAQAQRGELSRAAAKGIESGSTLDPAEAEADLRAKLAVIQLHAPGAAAPPLAAPSGQPTSAGDRAARLAAQRQRVTLAGQAMPLDAAAPAPAASRPQAPVAHPAPAMAGAPAPARTGNAYVDAFQALPSKQATELWAEAGTHATTQAAADQARFDGALQPLPVVLDGREPAGGKGGAAAGAGAHTAKPLAKGITPPAAKPTPTPAAPPVTAGKLAAQSLQASTDKAKLKADGQRTLAALPTSSPAVKTDPGPAPVTDLAGQADPVRALGDQQHAAGDGAKALDDTKTKVVTGPGAAQVQPARLDEKLNVPKEQASGPMPALPPIDGMARFKKWNLPASVQSTFDSVAKPKMDASLAQAKAKMTEAETRRDADRSKAVADAHDKVKHAHADADKQQQAKVAETRTQIANKQADTLVKQENEVKKLDQQSGDKKKATVGKINDRIQSDQAKVETDYQNAQKKADDQKKQGEAAAAQKKKQAQDKAKKDESWWDKAVDTICDDIKAVANEIDHALEAIGKAIGQLLDAVKDAACKLIDAARDFVCQALTEFGDWLKAAVTAMIGSVFPELAAALNRLIDQAVTAAKAAVNAIADNLKKAVTALCDGLKAAIDAAIKAFKAAIQAAATFAQALVTGDWKLVGKMILDGILSALGIDPAAFYALIGKAEDSIEKIIDNPGAFVGHLIDAVKLGFKQFGANFWTHLKDGMVQWLFGTFAEAGIHMPAKFDIAGIFDLVAQVLGLTWPKMRGKVVKVIGEKNTERLEFVWKYVEALITGGFAGLWEKIQQDMSGLWDMVVGGIKSWLIEKVVQQAIIKIATMWNPVGAIIQLIETAWNVYQWVRENAQRIFGLVQAVVDSVSNIVAGNIGGAANFIEASLAKLVPVAISLFADLIGLGGISGQIKGIIEKVQTTVDSAIDKLIARVMAMFKGKGDGKKTDAPPEERIRLAEQEVQQLVAKGIEEDELAEKLEGIKSKYDLVSLQVEKQGERVRIRGEINPTFEVVAEEIKNDKEKAAQLAAASEDHSDEFTTFFRAMSLEELNAIRVGKKLMPEMRTPTVPKGMNFITTNAEYAKKLMADPKHGKKYEYLVKITVEPGTQAMLEDPQIARIERPNKPTEKEFRGDSIRSRGKNERGIVVLKIEPLPAGGGAMNYGLTAKTLDGDDPVQMFNARIISIEVIGRMVDS